MTAALTAAVPGVRLAISLSLLLVAAPALGSGFSAPVTGTGWSSPATSDPAAVYWNPALVGDAGGFRLLGGLSVHMLRARHVRERRARYPHEDGFRFQLPLSPEDVDLSKTGRAPAAEGTSWLPGGALFFEAEIGAGFSAGLGVYAPYAAVLDLPSGGPQRWSLQQARLFVVHVTPAVSYEPAPWIRLGAGLQLAFGLLEMKRVVDVAGTDLIADALASEALGQPNDFGPDAGPALRELRVLSRPLLLRDAFAFAPTFHVGLAVRPHPTVTIGLAYHHEAEMRFEGNFSLDMKHEFFTQDLAAQGLAYAPRVDGEAWVELVLPPSIKAGVAWQATPARQLLLSAEVFFYSRVERLRVTLRSPELAQPEVGIPDTTRVDLPREWLDTFTLTVTAGYRVSDTWTLGASLGYQSPASPDETVDLASIDGHAIVADLLVAWQPLPALSLHLDFRAQGIVPRTVRASRHDLGNGTYEMVLLTLAAAAQYTF